MRNIMLTHKELVDHIYNTMGPLSVSRRIFERLSVIWMPKPLPRFQGFTIQTFFFPAAFISAETCNPSPLQRRHDFA